MKLNIGRSQEHKKGLLGGNKVSFKLDCKFETTKSEENLIDHYNVRHLTLLWKDTPEGKTPRLNVSDLITGRRFSNETLGEIVKLERDIIEASQAFHQILLGMQSYGGQESIELASTPTPEPDNDNNDLEP